MLSTVDKAARVLALFTSREPEWGVSEVARAMGLPKSSAHALLAALAKSALLVRTEANRYRLGWRLLSMSRVLLDSSDALTHVQPSVRTLTQRFGLTVHVAALDEEGVLCVEKARGHRASFDTGSRVGGRHPAHATALGKMLLAHAPPPAVDRVLGQSGLKPLTPRTVTATEHLLDELVVVRDRGWSANLAECTPGVHCYAAPIFDRGRRLAAAISVSVPAAEDEAHPGRFAQLVVAAGTAASRRLRQGETELERTGRAHAAVERPLAAAA